MTTHQERGSAGPPDSAATRLGQPAPDGARAQRTQLGGGASAAGRDDDAVLRFGPGVSKAPAWTANRPSGGTRRRRSPAPATGALLALAQAAVLAYLLLWRPEPLAVTGVDVAAAVPPGTACDVTVDVVGTVRTNGRAGVLGYRWLRSDGEVTAPLTQSVAADTPYVQVHLLWTFSGRGSYPATATLEILEPQPVTAAGGFTYLCR